MIPTSPFWTWADKTEITESRFPAAERWTHDPSHPAMRVNLDACIQCNLCVRACREVQVNDVIGMAFRNAGSKIVFDFDDPMGDSTCVACGECVQACPTGALMPAAYLNEDEIRVVWPDKKVDSLCPYCGVGCQVKYEIKDKRVVYAQGRNGPANHNRLCVKGRFGFDYIHHPHRLTKPLIRLPNTPKHAMDQIDPANPWTHFREASWEEALDFAANGLSKVRSDSGPRALAGFGSAKGSNEEAYLFQKLVRTGFGSNNVDHCTRLCHASSVAALMEGLNSGAVSAPFMAALDAEVIVIIGANPTVNHPVAATFIKNAVKQHGREADRHGPAAPVADPPFDAPPAVQARQRRRPVERDAAHHHHRGPGRPAVHRRLHRGLRRTCRPHQGLRARAHGRGLRHPGRDDPHRRPHVCDREVEPNFLGHGHQPARARHGQFALSDRAGAGPPGRSAGPALGCTPSAARTTCRARRTPG